MQSFPSWQVQLSPYYHHLVLVYHHLVQQKQQKREELGKCSKAPLVEIPQASFHSCSILLPQDRDHGCKHPQLVS